MIHAPRLPHLARFLLRWAPLGDRREEIEADFAQLYEARAAERGRRHAAWRACMDAISLWGRPLAGTEVVDRQNARPDTLMALRIAVRRLRAHPAAAVTAVVTLATSIAASAVTWSVLSAVLLHPLPVRTPDTLVVVGLRYDRGRAVSEAQLYPLYQTIRATKIFSGLAAGGDGGMLRVDANGTTQLRSISFASFDYFQTLGVALALGNGFTSEDDRRGAPLTAVLSDRMWRSTFGADARVVGQTLGVQGRPVRILGVAPRAFRGLSLTRAPDLYMPLHTVVDAGSAMFNPFDEPNTGFSPTAWVTIVGRLPLGVPTAATADRLAAVAPTGATVVLTPVNSAAIPEAARPDITRFARWLGAAVGLLLLIGCLSVGMLLLVHTEARRDEFALCLALGATRLRLAASVLIDGALLACAGALLAVPTSAWLFASIRVFSLPGGIDVDPLQLSIDGRVLVAVTSAALGAILIIAGVAGASCFASDLGDALRARTGHTPRLRRRRTRTGLVIAQVSVAMILLSGAGLLARSLALVLRLNPGYDTSHLITANVNLGPYGYDANRSTTFFDALRGTLAARPAISGVALIASGGGMSGGGRLAIDGESRVMPSFTEFVGIDEHYLSTMGLAVTRGRDFSHADVGGAPLVAIVTESLGRFAARGDNPIGHRIGEFFHRNGETNTIEIVGVVPDVITRVTNLAPFVLYRPLAQQPVVTMSRTIVIHAGERADLAAREFPAVLRQLDPTVTASPARTVDEQLLSQMVPQRFGLTVLGALGAIAILLTVLSTAVLSESLAETRQREMTIRAALGANGRQLARCVLGETARAVVMGLLAGLVMSWLGAATIRGFLFQIQPLDPMTLAAVAAVIFALALAVSLRPALRVARVDLARLLKED